jgi:hypothetical protein
MLKFEICFWGENDRVATMLIFLLPVKVCSLKLYSEEILPFLGFHELADKDLVCFWHVCWNWLELPLLAPISVGRPANYLHSVS